MVFAWYAQLVEHTGKNPWRIYQWSIFLFLLYFGVQESIFVASSNFYFLLLSSTVTKFLTIFLGRFTKEGVLVEGLFWKDVEKLIDDYNSERKSK